MKNQNEEMPIDKTQQKCTVVVTDDEPINTMNLKEMLESNNCEVVGTACDGFEAISLCKRFHPDVLLLDIKMPILDGLTVADYVHKNELADTIIIISAFNDESFIQTAGESGVAGYLVKPIEENNLISTIRIARMRSMELREMDMKMKKLMKDVETRKKIEQAKGLLMEKGAFSERQSYDYIRNISKDKGLSMDVVAEIIISSARK